MTDDSKPDELSRQDSMAETRSGTRQGLSRRQWLLRVGVTAGIMGFPIRNTSEGAQSELGAQMQIRSEGNRGFLRVRNGDWLQFTIPVIGTQELRPKLTVDKIEDGWQRVRMTWNVEQPVQQDEVSIRFQVAFEPDFWWAPHLAPSPGDCIAQHVFRSPAIIAAKGPDVVVMVPELEIVGAEAELPWFMDLDAPARLFWLGLGKSEVFTHTLFHKVPGMTIQPGKVELGFFVNAYRSNEVPLNPWSKVLAFLWNRYARPLYARGEPSTVPMDGFVKRTYELAFEKKGWKDVVWQEFEINGRRVGGPTLLVQLSQSPNHVEPASWLFDLSVWNQAWFSSMRTGAGILRYARRTGNDAFLEKAELTKSFTLAAPMNDGLFPSIYATEMETAKVEDKEVRQSKGWGTGFWTNTPTAPAHYGVTRKWYHIVDMSWTSLQILRWYSELEHDPRLLEYAKKYAAKLVMLQREDGFFPAWLDPETLRPAEVLARSPETSVSVTLLLKLADVTGDQSYKQVALKAMDVVLAEIVPAGRWEDYETYWSCSNWGSDEFVGKRVPRNGMYKQCNLSMFWTAEALLQTYKHTKDPKYLKWGCRTLNEMSMTQQVWQPPFIYVPALGGFGVMNADGEWNDARQSLFAELYMDYYKELGDPQLFERGVTALKASFIMMYAPENAREKVLWEKQFPFLGPEDYGFEMENYGHKGRTDPNGEGIYFYSEFNWGNGSGAEARNRIYDHYGDVYIDRQRAHGFGIDSIAVHRDGSQWVLQDLGGQPRDLKVVFEDGSSKHVRLDGKATL